METPAENKIIDTVVAYLNEHREAKRFLNLGAGRSVVLENKLANRGCAARCDRVDIDDCTVNHPGVDNCYVCSAESMTPVASEAYDVVFSNYVLEHIEDINSTAREIVRVLKPGGIFVASIPNPRAPEFMVAKHTPFWFHRFVRGGTGWHTVYAFPSVRALTEILSGAGLEALEIAYYPIARQYFERWRPLVWLASIYDGLVGVVGWRSLMGNVCLVHRKPIGNS